jgi:hypothetical protein
MPKTAGKNKHQKAAHRPGERKVSRAQVAELLELSCSSDAGERLVAAQFLCPCHVRARIPEVWDALYRMMEDTDRRVRYAAWHTLEDGGLPKDPDTVARLERLFQQETDPKIRKFAEHIIGAELFTRNKQEVRRLQLMGHPAQRQRGKCDFCGMRNMIVERDLETMIPTDDWPRPALICERCAE